MRRLGMRKVIKSLGLSILLCIMLISCSNSEVKVKPDTKDTKMYEEIYSNITENFEYQEMSIKVTPLKEISDYGGEKELRDLILINSENSYNQYFKRTKDVQSINQYSKERYNYIPELYLYNENKYIKEYKGLDNNGDRQYIYYKINENILENMKLEENLNNLQKIPMLEDLELIDIKQYGSDVELTFNIRNNRYLDIPKYIPEYFVNYNDIVVKEGLLTVYAHTIRNNYIFQLFVVCENDEDSFGIYWDINNLDLSECEFADWDEICNDNFVIEREDKDGILQQVFYNGFETDLFKIYQPDDIIELFEDTGNDDLYLLAEKIYSNKSNKLALFVPNDEMIIAIFNKTKALEFLGISDSNTDSIELVLDLGVVTTGFSTALNSMTSIPEISLVSQDEVEIFEIDGTTAYRKRAVLEGGGDTAIFYQVVTTNQDKIISISLLNFPEGTKEEYKDYYQVMIDTMELK